MLMILLDILIYIHGEYCGSTALHLDLSLFVIFVNQHSIVGSYLKKFDNYISRETWGKIFAVLILLGRYLKYLTFILGIDYNVHLLEIWILYAKYNDNVT